MLYRKAQAPVETAADPVQSAQRPPDLQDQVGNDFLGAVLAARIPSSAPISAIDLARQIMEEDEEELGMDELAA
jgi:hypothetical protein